MRISLFIALFTFLYTSLHAYAFFKLSKAISLRGIAFASVVLFMILMILTPVLVRALESGGFEKGVKVLAYAGYSWMGFLFLFVTASLGFDLWRLLVYAAEGLLKTRLGFLHLGISQAFLLSFVAALCAAGYGMVDAALIRTERIAIKSSKITRPIRVVQISDVHLGLLVREPRLNKILDKVKAVRPDLLVSTGDLVDGETDSLHGVGNLLREVKAPLGKFAVTGNHEVYAGLDRSVEFTTQAGFRMLRGEGANVAGLINVAGMDDPAARVFAQWKPAAERDVLSSLPRHRFTLLLKHRPEVDRSAEGLFDLQLSGHAHKGQIFPFTLIVRLVTPYLSGLYELPSGSRLYVSRGCGTWGPPIRFLAPPEITVIDLVPGKS